MTDLDKVNLQIRQLKAKFKNKELVEQFAKNCCNFNARGEQTTSTGGLHRIKDVSQGKHGTPTKVLKKATMRNILVSHSSLIFYPLN